MRSHFLKYERLIVKSLVTQREVQLLKQVLDHPTLVENNLAIDVVDKRIEIITKKGEKETRSNTLGPVS